MMQNLVSERIRRKAETIIVIKEDESDSRIYFKAIWSAPNGKHEYSIIYSKEEKPLLDRFDCSCVFCSNYNVFDQRMCAYKYAVFLWLVENGVLRKELLCEDEAI